MSQLILLLSISLVVCNLLLFSMCIYNIFFCATTLVQFMNAFDRAMNLLDEKYSFLASTKQIVSSTNEEDKVQLSCLIDICFVSYLRGALTKLNQGDKSSKVLQGWFFPSLLYRTCFIISFMKLIACYTLQVIVFERGDLVFVFNFHPEKTYDGYVCFN